jgi:hypothetical protein
MFTRPTCNHPQAGFHTCPRCDRLSLRLQTADRVLQLFAVADAAVKEREAQTFRQAMAQAEAAKRGGIVVARG